MAIAMMTIFPSCSSEEPVVNNEFRTRAVEDWDKRYVIALDELMEGAYAGNDEVSLVLLSSIESRKYLSDKAFNEFVNIAKSYENDNYPEYCWEKTAYIAQEGSDWVLDDRGNYLYPYRVRNVLYVLYIDEDGGYLKYIQPYGNSEYCWFYDPE